MDDIVGIGARPHLYFFDFYDRVLFRRAMGFLFLLVAEFAIIHHSANRRLRFCCDFDEIDFQRFHLLQGFVQRQHPVLFPFRSDDPNLAGADLMINSRFSCDKTPPCQFRLTVEFMLLRSLVQLHRAGAR